LLETSVFDALLDEEILATIGDAEAQRICSSAADVPIYQIIRYHLGFLNARFEPQRGDAGKRIRPRLCVLACEALEGSGRRAIHAAAAIELLHNFTLIHDDIQDHSPLRRHRETVWNLWGIPQAINAGDAIFALAHLALNRSHLADIPSDVVLSLSTELHQTTLRIVEGQVLDLSFEDRGDVTVDEYLEMIGGKTAAICLCACSTGAALASADTADRKALAAFGFALGVGFQLRDDLLGVWGATSATGKAEADDIRRRKKALPYLILFERAGDDDREDLSTIYAQPELSPASIEHVLELMTRYEVREAVQEQVGQWHDQAAAHLEAAVPAGPAQVALNELVRSLETRHG
jgi:geranylgeranyl diphosphate synthase, type I